MNFFLLKYRRIMNKRWHMGKKQLNFVFFSVHLCTDLIPYIFLWINFFIIKRPPNTIRIINLISLKFSQIKKKKKILQTHPKNFRILDLKNFDPNFLFNGSKFQIETQTQKCIPSNDPDSSEKESNDKISRLVSEVGKRFFWGVQIQHSRDTSGDVCHIRAAIARVLMMVNSKIPFWQSREQISRQCWIVYSRLAWAGSRWSAVRVKTRSNPNTMR